MNAFDLFPLLILLTLHNSTYENTPINPVVTYNLNLYTIL